MLGGAGVPKAGQSTARELDGQGSGQGSGPSPIPEVCLGAQQVSTPPALLTAAPLPPQHAIAFCLKESGSKPPMVMYPPPQGLRSPCPSPRCWPGCSQTPPLPLAAALPHPALGWPPSHSGSGTPPGFTPLRGRNPRPPHTACMTADLEASPTSDLTRLPPADSIPQGPRGGPACPLLSDSDQPPGPGKRGCAGCHNPLLLPPALAT